MPALSINDLTDYILPRNAVRFMTQKSNTTTHEI